MITDFNKYLDDNNFKLVLLVEPHFPVPKRSRNHSNNTPLGLLKIASLLDNKHISYDFIRFDKDNPDQSELFPEQKPAYDLILVSSLFTYWSKYVKETVHYYKRSYPKVPIIVGGIYPSLLPIHCLEYTGCTDIVTGQIKEAEELIPNYELIDADYQIIHTSRGCIRQCGFCGTYKIEPHFSCLKTITDKITKKKLIFYDNNILANPFVENILTELKELKKTRKISTCESQSGFDGRILEQKPHLAKMLKEAGFRNPKIAWDWGYKDKDRIKKQIDTLTNAGYRANSIGVFMLYNWKIPYLEMERKRVAVFEWGCTIMDCRFRPLTQTYDEFNMRRKQNNEDYYIHSDWTDEEVKNFRRNVRKTNICNLFGTKYYVKESEKGMSKEERDRVRSLEFGELVKEGYTVYDPRTIGYLRRIYTL